MVQLSGRRAVIAGIAASVLLVALGSGARQAWAQWCKDEVCCSYTDQESFRCTSSKPSCVGSVEINSCDNVPYMDSYYYGVDQYFCCAGVYCSADWSDDWICNGERIGANRRGANGRPRAVVARQVYARDCSGRYELLQVSP